MSNLDKYKLQTEFLDDLSTKHQNGLSHWKREKLLGSGAFGTVWLEKEDPGGLLRAVKSIRRQDLAGTGFSQELIALITLSNHKHLFVEFYGWYENDTDVFFAMQFLAYGDLGKYIEDREQATAGASEILQQIVEGLEVLHREGICHRDLKPQNILMASLQPIWVKIADFGTSKQTNLTLLRTSCGTPGYLAPELIGLSPKPASGYTYALDMWSLGCLLHKVLTSRTPFQEAPHTATDLISGLSASDFETQTDAALLYQYCCGEAEFPVGVLEDAGVSDAAVDLLVKLLNPNPDLRPTAAAVRMHPWLADGAELYNAHWYKILKRELSELGVQLDLGNRVTEIRQLVEPDVLQYLPPAAANELPAILQHAIENDFAFVTSALVRSPNPALHDALGTVFQRAVRGGEIGLVKQLLATYGVAVLNAYVDGRTPLQVAASGADRVMVQLLLENGANINASASADGGRTALQAAAGSGNNAIVELLLSSGADIYASPSPIDGRTVLHAAVESGQFDLVTLLVDKRKADTSAGAFIPRDFGALSLASSTGRIDIVQLLLSHEDDADLGEGAEIGFRFAVEHGRVEMTELFLKLGADPNAVSGTADGRKGLEIAASNGHTEVVRLLLAQGARINDVVDGQPGLTALFVAARDGGMQMVDLLLSAGARVNAANQTYGDHSALQAAAEGGFIDTVKLLLSKGATVNPRGPTSGLTAFHGAAGNGHLDVMMLLLSAGANIHGGVTTALDVACLAGHANVVDMLLSAGVCAGSVRGWGPLANAAENGHVEIVELLLPHLNINTSSREYTKALRAAANTGQLDIVKILMATGVNINKPWGLETALGAAARGGQVAMVELLLLHGADANPDHRTQKPPILELAAAGGSLEIVKILINHGAKLSWDPSAIRLAAACGNLEMVKLLLAAGGTVHGFQESAPVYAAALGGHLETVRFLLLKGAECGPALHAAATGGHVEVVNLLLAEGTEQDMKDYSVGIPLKAAARHGHREVVQVLLANGAEIDAEEKEPGHRNGYTALYEAVKNSHADVVELLLFNKAKVRERVRGSRGLEWPYIHEQPKVQTPLYAAAEMGNLGLVKMLLDRGAEVDETPHRSTALCGAASGGHLDVANLLIQEGANVNRGSSPLVPAAKHGHLRMVRLLLANGVDNDDDKWGSGALAALRAAVCNGHIRVVKLLLESAPPVSSIWRGTNWEATLYSAIDSGHIHIVKLLILTRHDPQTNRQVLHEALRRAAVAGYSDLFNLLCSDSFSLHSLLEPLLEAAVASGCVEIVRSCLSKGANPKAHETLDSAIVTGQTTIIELLLSHFHVATAVKNDSTAAALKQAAVAGYIDIVRLLLQAGAQVNSPAFGLRRQAAFRAATEGGHARIASLLVSAGAQQTSDSQPPSDLGVPTTITALGGATIRGHTDIVQLLLSSGAQVDALCGPITLRSPLRYAVTGHHIDIVRALLEHGATLNSNKRLEMISEGIADIGIVQLLLDNTDVPADKALARWVSRRGSDELQWLFVKAGGTILSPENSSSWLGWRD